MNMHRLSKTVITKMRWHNIDEATCKGHVQGLTCVGCTQGNIKCTKYYTTKLVFCAQNTVTQIHNVYKIKHK